MAERAASRALAGLARRPRDAEFAVVLTLIAFVAAAALASFLLGLDEVWDKLRRITLPLVLALLALSLVNYGCRMLRWHLYGRRLGIGIPLGRSSLYYLAGLAMTPTPGKIGEALRLWLLARSHGVPYDRSLPLLLADRLSDTIVLVALTLLCVAAFTDRLLPALLVSGLLAAFILAFLRPRLLLLLCLHLYGLTGRFARAFARARRALRRTAGLFEPRTFALASLLAATGWLAEALGLALLLRALEAPIGIIASVFVFSFSILVGAISLLPGGLIGAEATMFGLLVALGATSTTALAATALCRLATLWFGVGLGFLALPAAMRLARSEALEREGGRR